MYSLFWLDLHIYQLSNWRHTQPSPVRAWAHQWLLDRVQNYQFREVYSRGHFIVCVHCIQQKQETVVLDDLYGRKSIIIPTARVMDLARFPWAGYTALLSAISARVNCFPILASLPLCRSPGHFSWCILITNLPQSHTLYYHANIPDRNSFQN